MSGDNSTKAANFIHQFHKYAGEKEKNNAPYNFQGSVTRKIKNFTSILHKRISITSKDLTVVCIV